MREQRVHGSLDGSSQGFPGLQRMLAGRIRIVSYVASGVAKIDGNQDLVMRGVRQPLARRLDPKDAIDLDRGVPCARLDEQRISPQPRR